MIHAFGALFGLGVVLALTSKKEMKIPIKTDYISDRFSMLGSMILWIFWPSFCAALVPVAQIPETIVNVVLALCGSTIATYILSVTLRGKISIADIANAALAGGVAIGSTCVFATPLTAIIIGLLAGSISTIGFAIIQSKLQKTMKMIDTCGVTNLHGFPGLMGGLAAIIVVSEINIQNQIYGILITLIIGISTGFFTGKTLSIFKRRISLYNDSEEFLDV